MKVLLSKRASARISHLPKTEQVKIRKKLLLLENNPLTGKKLAGELSGDRSIRAWPYRIIYRINMEGKRIEVSDIIHRQGVYK